MKVWVTKTERELLRILRKKKKTGMEITMERRERLNLEFWTWLQNQEVWYGLWQGFMKERKNERMDTGY